MLANEHKFFLKALNRRPTPFSSLGVDLSSEAVMAIEALFLLINSGPQNKQASKLALKVSRTSLLFNAIFALGSFESATVDEETALDKLGLPNL